jgi:hypothetical protein
VQVCRVGRGDDLSRLLEATSPGRALLGQPGNINTSHSTLAGGFRGNACLFTTYLYLSYVLTGSKFAVGHAAKAGAVGAERGEQSRHGSHPGVSTDTFTFTLAEIAAMAV